MAPILREVIFKAKVDHIDYGLNLFNILNTQKVENNQKLSRFELSQNDSK